MRDRAVVLSWVVGCLWLLVWSPFGASAAAMDPLHQAEEDRDPQASALQTATTSSDPKRRRRAAQVWGRIQDRQAIKPLLRLSHDPSKDVRAMALFGLGQLAWSPAWTKGARPQIMRRLKAGLLDREPEVQRRAIEALGKFASRRAVRWLRPLLKRGGPMIQAEVLLALFWVRYLGRSPTSKRGATSSPSFPSDWWLKQMKRLAGSPSAKVRRAVIYYFARLKDRRGLALAFLLARDQDRIVRMFAMMALRKLADPRGASAARRACKDRSWHVRVAALQALRAMKRPTGLPRSLHSDPSFHVRAAFVRTSASQKQPPVALWKTLWRKDPSRTVRATALDAMCQHETPDNCLLRLLKALHHKDWLLREATIRASRHLGWRRESFLAMAINDTDVRVRAAAIMALRKTPVRRIFQWLARALRSKQLAERGAAVHVLTHRKEKKARRLAWDVYQRSQSSRWVELREELAGFFARHVTPATTRYLKKISRDPAPSVANQAIRALRKRGQHITPTSKPHRARIPSPYRAIRFSHDPIVELRTSKGRLVIRCFAQQAPVHVASFVQLVKKGFYRGLLWHRVIPNFVIQGGDPDGTGWGAGPFQLRAEINTRRFVRGSLGMPRARGWDTGSVQLFFNHITTPHLDGRYTVFGQVIQGLDVLDRIERGDQILHARVRPTQSRR